MPATSRSQRRAAGAALSVKRGETPGTMLRGASTYMPASMIEKELEELATTPRKGLPDHVDDKRVSRSN